MHMTQGGSSVYVFIARRFQCSHCSLLVDFHRTFGNSHALRVSRFQRSNKITAVQHYSTSSPPTSSTALHHLFQPAGEAGDSRQQSHRLSGPVVPPGIPVYSTRRQKSPFSYSSSLAKACGLLSYRLIVMSTLSIAS